MRRSTKTFRRALQHRGTYLIFFFKPTNKIGLETMVSSSPAVASLLVAPFIFFATSAVANTCDPKNNPCLASDAIEGQFFVHDNPDHYIQCGAVVSGRRLCYEMPCSPGTVWNQEIKGCAHDCSPDQCNDPCSLGEHYHPHCSDEKKFIQCDDFGGCFVMDCAPGTVWSQKYRTCVNDCSMVLGGASNPCPKALAEGRSATMYEPDGTKYVQCDEFAGCYIMPCGDQMIWSEKDGSCIKDPLAVIVKPDSGGVVKTCENGRVYDYNFNNCVKPCRGMPEGMENPCNYETVHIEGRMYHEHWEKKRKFVQCYPNGNCFIGDCPEGEKWSQYRQMCVSMEFDCGGEANADLEEDFASNEEKDEWDEGGDTGESRSRMLRSRHLGRSSDSSSSRSSQSSNKAEANNRAWQKGCEEVRVDRPNGVPSHDKGKSSKGKGGSGGKGGKSSKSYGKGGGKGGSGKSGKSSRRAV